MNIHKTFLCCVNIYLSTYLPIYLPSLRNPKLHGKVQLVVSQGPTQKNNHPPKAQAILMLHVNKTPMDEIHP